MMQVRCARHESLKQLNDEADGQECGGCIAEEVAALVAQHEEDSRYILELWKAIGSARDRLNLASAGAGDYLDKMLPQGWDDPETDSTQET